MLGTELVVTETLCFASGVFHISPNNSYSASAGTRVLVCGQSVISNYFNFFEGGLLCLRSCLIWFLLFWCSAC